MYDISVEYNCLEDLRRGRRLEGAEEISETFETVKKTAFWIESFIFTGRPLVLCLQKKS